MFRKSNPRGFNAALAWGLECLRTVKTDYELGVFRLYSFKVHEMLDYGVAATSAAIPALLGFDKQDSGRSHLLPTRRGR